MKPPVRFTVLSCHARHDGNGWLVTYRANGHREVAHAPQELREGERFVVRNGEAVRG